MTPNSKYDYVYNIEDYQGVDKLKELTTICHQELEHINWVNLIDELQLSKKETSGISWQYATGNDTVLVESIDSNTGDKIAGPTGDLGSWLFLIISPVNNDYIGYKISSIVEKTFPRTVKAVQSLPGVFHAHLNRITPNFRVPPHTDDLFGNIISVVLTLQISSRSAELVTLTINGTPHNFKNTEYFLFKSQLEHYADNKSDSDWIVMSIQLEKNYFNI